MKAETGLKRLRCRLAASAEGHLLWAMIGPLVGLLPAIQLRGIIGYSSSLRVSWPDFCVGGPVAGVARSFSNLFAAGPCDIGVTVTPG